MADDSPSGDAIPEQLLVSVFSKAIELWGQIEEAVQANGYYSHRINVSREFRELRQLLDDVGPVVPTLPRAIRDELEAIGEIVNQASCNIAFGEVCRDLHESDLTDHGNAGWRETIRLSKGPTIPWAAPAKPTRRKPDEPAPVESGADFIERLVAGPDDIELSPHEMALLEAHLKQPVSFGDIQREKQRTGESVTQKRRNKLKLIRDFNRKLQSNSAEDATPEKPDAGDRKPPEDEPVTTVFLWDDVLPAKNLNTEAFYSPHAELARDIHAIGDNLEREAEKGPSIHRVVESEDGLSATYHHREGDDPFPDTKESIAKCRGAIDVCPESIRADLRTALHEASSFASTRSKATIAGMMADIRRLAVRLRTIAHRVFDEGQAARPESSAESVALSDKRNGATFYPRAASPELLQDFIDLASEIIERIAEPNQKHWWQVVELMTARLETIYERIDGPIGDNFPPFRVITVRPDDDDAVLAKYGDFLLGSGNQASCAMYWADSEVSSGGVRGLWFVDKDGVERFFPKDTAEPIRILRWWIRHMERRLRRSEAVIQPASVAVIPAMPQESPPNAELLSPTITTLDDLESAVPKLDQMNTTEWCRAARLKSHGESAGIEALQSQRSRGIKNAIKAFGVCETGRIWRKDLAGRKVWYWIPSLHTKRDLEAPLISAALTLIRNRD